MRKYLIVFALLAVALTACRVETNVTMSIEEDGSGTVGFEIGMDDEFRDLMEQSGGSMEDILTDLPDIGGGDVTPTNRVDGDMTYIGVESVVADISEFDFSSEGGDFFSSFSYESDGKSSSLQATISAGDVAGDTGDLPFDPSSLTGDLFSANVVISMPGTVIEHNADKVLGDGTLVWSIPLSGSTDIFAKSTFGGSSNSWIIWVLVIVLLVGVVAAVTATIVSRKESQKAVATAAAAAGTSDEAIAPPPAVEATQELEIELEPTEPAPDAVSVAEEPDDAGPDNGPDDAGPDDSEPDDGVDDQPENT